MSWINNKSGLLIDTDRAIAFAFRTELQTNGKCQTANFFNAKILIRIYEERTFLHADYYDLQALRWARELHNDATEWAIPNLTQRQSLISGFAPEGDVLNSASMRTFSFVLYAIENFMKDFLSGDLHRYSKWMLPVPLQERKSIEEIVF